MNKQWLVLLACIALVGMGNEGCQATKSDKLPVVPRVQAPTNQVETVSEYSVVSKGHFNAGYDDAAREIFILKNNFTGEEYLGITDCTIIRIIKKKKEN